MWLAGIIIGLIVGAVAGNKPAIFGAIVGGLIGWYIENIKKSADQRLQEMSERINVLSGNVYHLKRRLHALGEQQTPIPHEVVPPVVSVVSVVSEIPVETFVPEGTSPIDDRLPSMISEPAVPAMAMADAEAPSSQREPAIRPAAKPNPMIQWLLGGNTVVRVGIVILFFGIAFLLKYAYEHSHVPISVRLTGVGIGALALLAFGWHLRERRAGYALTLQGGGIGVLYLNIFAAFRFYEMIPATPAFALLLAIVGLSAMLAILQNSLALAVFGVSGGFLAPLLISTGQGNHVMLFSYCLMLNLGILAISWHKAWRILNLLGFAFTFAIGRVWAWKYYGPEHFSSVEFFLILFFLLYVLIPVLFARKQSEEARTYVDGTLVFGVPLVAFGLQAGLVREFEYGAAWSALGLAAFYVSLASLLWRQTGEKLRLLSEAFLALGVVFATLAIPLAFDGRMTSAFWALEGAAIVWIGLRQQRVLARSFGIALQFLAGIAFLIGVKTGHGAIPILNSFFLGCVLVAVGGLFCSAYLERRRESTKPWEPAIAGILLGWGVLWWVAAGLLEINRHAPDELHLHGSLLFLAASAAVFSVFSRSLSWQSARWPAYALLPIAILHAWHGALGHVAPSSGLGFIAWPVTFLLHLRILRRHEGSDPSLQYGLHAAGLWLLAFVAAREFAWQIDVAVAGELVWPLIAWAVAPCTLLALLTTPRCQTTWPVAAHAESYLIAGALPLAVFVGAWTAFANFTSNGDPAPLPYLPLLNPLDIAQGLVFLTITYWLMSIRKLGYDHLLGEEVPTPLYALLGAALFIFANGVLLRTLHHWAAVPFHLNDMLHSVLVQASFSIFWTVLALGTMTLATRRSWRSLWFAGASLMAVVVIKLFMVDLSNVGGMERIVSFIGVGVLMLIVGYFSPAPPSSPPREPLHAH